MFNLRMKATNVKNRGFSSGILQVSYLVLDTVDDTYQLNLCDY